MGSNGEDISKRYRAWFFVINKMLIKFPAFWPGDEFTLLTSVSYWIGLQVNRTCPEFERQVLSVILLGYLKGLDLL